MILRRTFFAVAALSTSCPAWAKRSCESLASLPMPGMWHCQGGPGTTDFDMLGPLDKWADKGIAPDKVIASHTSNGVVDRTRPLCPFPQEAQWKGAGSTDDALNFVCALPKL
jgi:feruloyl esterase